MLVTSAESPSTASLLNGVGRWDVAQGLVVGHRAGCVVAYFFYWRDVAPAEQKTHGALIGLMAMRRGEDHATQVDPPEPVREFATQDSSLRSRPETRDDFDASNALDVCFVQKGLQTVERSLSGHSVQVQPSLYRNAPGRQFAKVAGIDA
ncbi:hypothetical protein AA23498_1276 [Acetobacter nitrogenifigens DSM 23921 = NBRC 105050]|nr:hypothetical protein AA23498_1276 [Acetobacter nitrogenifigens DSM 23921 = NBRC 105050]